MISLEDSRRTVNLLHKIFLVLLRSTTSTTSIAIWMVWNFVSKQFTLWFVGLDHVIDHLIEIIDLECGFAN